MLGLIGGLLGGLFQAGAANRASDAQQEAANRQIDLQEQIYGRARRDLRPFYESGTNALGALNFEMGLGDRPQGYGGFEASPGYKFALGQGLDAVQGSAAAGGNLFSGQTLRALNDYGQGMARQDYGNYLARLQGMTGGGLQAASMGQAAGNTYAAGAGNALAGIGNAQAAGAIGVGNAINSGIGNGIGAWQYQQMLNGYQAR